MTNGRRRATIRDVAKLAGVSYGTVSRFLNGNTHVSPAAASRIADAIKTAQYTPNNAARSLAQHRTLTIALIIQVESQQTIVQASVSAAMAGANQVLGDAGYQMVTLIANSEQSTQRITELVHSDFADGYLLFSMSNDNSLTDTFRNLHRPVVRSEVSDRGDLPYPAVDFTNEQGQYDITRYLIDSGRTRVVYICGPGYSPTSLNRFKGFQRALGDAYDPRHIYYADDWEVASGELAIVAFEPIMATVDAVVCANDNIALGAINQLNRLGLTVPQDVAVTGFDDSPVAILANPKLTTVRQDSLLHGETMAHLILDAVRGSSVNEHTVVLLPTSIVRRQSA